MGMLEKLYLNFLDISYNSVLLILLILLARMVLKRVPKVFSYCLWAFVAFRLLFPATLEIPLGLSPPSKEAFPLFSPSETFGPPYTPFETAAKALKNAFNGDFRVLQISALMKTEGGKLTDNLYMDWYMWWESLVYFGQFLWVAGIFAMLLIGLTRYLRQRKLTAAFTCSSVMQAGVFKIKPKISIAPLAIALKTGTFVTEPIT